MGKIIFNWSVRRLCSLIDRIIAKDFDFVLVITGRRGLGKSTIAYLIALGTHFSKFNPNRDILFSKEDVTKAISTRKKGKMIADEIIQTAFSRDFFSEYNKMLIKALTMYRDSGNLFISCIPNFTSLDNQFRNLVRMRIDIVRRGLGVIHTPNKSEYTTDIWDTLVNERIERRWLFAGNQKPKYAKLTTFRGLIHFRDLTAKQKEKYLEIKRRKRNLIFEEHQEEKKHPEELTTVEILQQALLTGKIKNRKHLDEFCNSIGIINPEFMITKLAYKLRNLPEKKTISQCYTDKCFKADDN